MSPNNIPRIFSNTFKSLWNPQVILCFFTPIFLAFFFWLFVALILWQPIALFFHDVFSGNTQPLWSFVPEWLMTVLTSIGPALLNLLVALILFLIFIPLVIVTTTILTSIVASTYLIQFLGQKYFPHVEKRGSARLGKSLLHVIIYSVLYMVLWIVTLPLNFFPGAAFAIPALLTAWFNRKVGAFDVLTEWADDREFEIMLQTDTMRSYIVSLIPSLGIYLPLGAFFTPVMTSIALTFFYLEELNLKRQSKTA